MAGGGGVVGAAGRTRCGPAGAVIAALRAGLGVEDRVVELSVNHENRWLGIPLRFTTGTPTVCLPRLDAAEARQLVAADAKLRDAYQPLATEITQRVADHPHEGTVYANTGMLIRRDSDGTVFAAQPEDKTAYKAEPGGPLHASAVVRDGQAVLTLGDKGAGKTTAGLLLARAGWQLLANDRVFIRPEDGRLRVLPWPSAAAIGLGLLDALGWYDQVRERVQRGEQLRPSYRSRRSQGGGRRLAERVPITRWSCLRRRW
ncbi:hypothetical protein [Streptomyces sp. UNOB3_S3]|uniref:hypothetical protein n=1 Tax=Streptomyces sp. UNOB3_S3 TaxID=2871682 RepID=UPI0027E385A7|nr:hypothetical protein [Streptomyces sp. UNOB3_S3]MCC3775469.1 hypothetical protein [Streptomyces sp. UNOB3_S3]